MVCCDNVTDERLNTIGMGIVCPIGIGIRIGIGIAQPFVDSIYMLTPSLRQQQTNKRFNRENQNKNGVDVMDLMNA